MDDRMTVTTSVELGDLAKALATAQQEIKDAVRDASNPHFRSHFASLASVRAAVLPALTRHGLAVSQLPLVTAEGAGAVTMLLHGSGQWLRCDLVLPVGKRDPQACGSAISYARRYALGAIACVATDDDDDGEVAMGRNAERQGRGNDPPVAAVDTTPLFRAIETAKTADDLVRVADQIRGSQDRITRQEYAALRDSYQARLRTIAQTQGVSLTEGATQ